MNYTQLITEVQKVALKQHNVNSFSSNDVYDEWNKPHTQYASVNIGLESADRTENTIIYNCVLYYGDRLLQNASNKIAIQDDAVKVLQGIISNLPDEITYYTPINYTIFEQEFADYIAGAYCRVRLETEFGQGNCSLDDYIEELKTLYVTENGIFNVVGYDQVEVNVLEGITEEECREIIEGYDFATKDEIPSLDGYATESWVNEQGFLTEHQDLSEYAKTVDVNTGLESKQDKGDYALRSELPDMTNYATKQYVQDQIIEAGGVTMEQVDTEIENKLADKNYATKDEIPSLDGYATEEWVNNQHFLTEHQDLSEYAKKSEIPSLDGYATENWVNEQGFLTEHQELKTINGESIVGSGDITIEGGKQIYIIDATQDLGDDKIGFYLTQEVIDNLNDDNIPVYMKVKFTYNNVEYTELLEKKQNNEFITVNEETSKVSNNFPPFMTMWNTGAKNYFYLLEADPSLFNKYVNDGISVSVTINTDHSFNSRKSLETYFPTTEIVSAAIVELKNKDAEIEAKIPSLDGYATEQWVSDQGYLTEHQQLKTINGESIIGDGNIEIKGGSPVISYDGLMFTAEEDNSTIQLTQVGTSTLAYDFETSTDGKNWSTYTIGDVITLSKTGDKVCWRGNNACLGESASVYKKFVMSGKIAASGSISSIVQSFNASKYYQMVSLFENCTSLTSAPQLDGILSSTSSRYTFQNMFRNCTELIKGPSALFEPFYLPNGTIRKPTFGSYMCSGMFYGCTKLTSAPDIYFNSGDSSNYSSLLERCFINMFNGCASLETPAKFVYNKSAKGGGALQGANYAMFRMYYGCTKLTTTPELFFTAFGYGEQFTECFYRCTSLKTIVTNFVITSGGSGGHFDGWVTNVGTGGVFYDLANYNGLPSSSTSGIPSGWTVKYAYDNDIDDNHSTNLTTYSSSKINNLLSSVFEYDDATNTLNIII